MKDAINKCLLLLTLDDTVLEKYKEKVEKMFDSTDPNEIIEVLFEDNDQSQVGTRVIRKSLPMIIRNLKRVYEDVNEVRIQELFAFWNIDYQLPVPNDYRALSDILCAHDSDHLYLKGLPFNKKAYPSSFEHRVSCDIDFLVNKSMDDIYEYLIRQHGFLPLRKEPGAHEFYIHYLQHYVPLVKDGNKYEMHHRLCYPVLGGCKVNNYINEVFSRAIIDDSMGFPVKILSPEDQMFFHFCHMYYHQMYENAYHPKFYADIVGYIVNNNVDWEKVINFANKYDANKILFYCLLFLNEIHQYLFEEDLFDKSILIRIPKGMKNHLYECRSRTLFSDDVVGYHDSEPHELLFNYRHQTASYEHLNSFHHPKRKEDKRRFIEKMEQCGVYNYDYDTYGDITS